MVGMTKAWTRGLAMALSTGAMALASAAPAQAQFRDDYRGYERDRGQRYDSRDVVDQCVRAAERNASGSGRARVSEVLNVARTREGVRVYGTIDLGGGGRGWDRGRDRYDDQRYRGDRYDHGRMSRFSCVVSYGRVTDLDFSHR